MVASRSARYNVVAEYRDLRAARGAIEALQLRGVEAANISMSGPGANTAADSTSMGDTRRIDARLMTHTFGRAVAGMIAGAIIGCVIAAIGVGVTLAVTDAGSGSWIVIAFIGALAIGVVGGGMVTAATALPLTPDYDRTYADRDSGQIFVSVHAGRPEDIDRVVHVLEEKHALRVRRYQSPAA